MATSSSNLKPNTYGNPQTSIQNILDDVKKEFLDGLKQEFDMAFQDLQKDVPSNERLVAFVIKYYVNRLETTEFREALQINHEEEAISDPFILYKFFYVLSCFYQQHSMMGEALQSLDRSFTEKLDCFAIWKKASAVTFTAAAAAAATVVGAYANTDTNRPAAGAAAAASVLLLELRKWTHSLLRKRESTVMKHKHVIGVMITHGNIAKEKFKNIDVSFRRLQLEIHSMSETVDDGKVAAVKECFQELRGKAKDYRKNMNLARQVVVQSINAPA